MVGRVVGSRQVKEDNTCDQALLVAIFDVLRQVHGWLVHDFSGRNPACSGMSFASTCFLLPG